MMLGDNYSLDVKETKNHDLAMKYVEKLAAERQKLTEIDVCEIHSIVLKEIRPNDAGRYRRDNVYITGASSIPPE